MVARADTVFAGSIPKLYDEDMVPLIFEPYATDMARRFAVRAPARILEIATGTGVVTRALDAALPSACKIVATDLNPGMLQQASSVWRGRAVEWRQADAMQLPFPDASFDAIACQFGVMFFPDKAKAFAEARRVLRPGGMFIFSTWDRIEENEFADEVTNELARIFAADPPRFMARTPHGYHDRETIARDVVAGGFGVVSGIETIAHRSRAASPLIPARAYCQGTLLRNEIEARDASALARATEACAGAIAKRFGDGAVDGKIQAHVVTLQG